MLQILPGTLHLPVRGSPADRLSKQHTPGKSIHLPSSFIRFTLFICVVGWGRAYTYHGMRGEVREWLRLLYFHPMTSRNQTQAFRLNGKTWTHWALSQSPVPCAFLNPQIQSQGYSKSQATYIAHTLTLLILTTWEFKRNLGGSSQCFPIVTSHSVH